jgi:hypothetical protein
MSLAVRLLRVMGEMILEVAAAACNKTSRVLKGKTKEAGLG